MPFKTGDKGNPNGRPKGSLNKNTELKLKLKKFMDDNIDGFLAKIMKMDDPETQLKYVIQLMPYVSPKLKEATLEIDLTSQGEPITGISIEK